LRFVWNLHTQLDKVSRLSNIEVRAEEKAIAQVHLVTDAQVNAVKGEMEEATPIVPTRMVLLRVSAPATDELPDIPDHFEETLSLAFRPEVAVEVAHAILAAASALRFGLERCRLALEQRDTMDCPRDATLRRDEFRTRANVA
jgi:hypothetical protein